jgi:hypothetical protein
VGRARRIFPGWGLFALVDLIASPRHTARPQVITLPSARQLRQIDANAATMIHADVEMKAQGAPPQ